MLDSVKWSLLLVLAYLAIAVSTCQIDCPDNIDDVVCAFDEKQKIYKVFTSHCALKAHNECYKDAFTETPFQFCVKQHFKSRRSYQEEACPVFCAQYYRPVCAAYQYRSYKYRAFINSCYLDMVNCRGEEDEGYIQVPLSYCPRHLMKNIFKEQVVASYLYNRNDY